MPIPGNNLRDNLFMAPATEGTYEQWWWQFIAEHEDWRYADSDALRKAAFEGGQESLRQQLAEAQAALVQTRDSLEAACNGLRWWIDAFPLHVTEADNEEMLKIVKALAIQPDDSALKAWLGKPVAWEVSDNWGAHYTNDKHDWYDAVGIESVTPLYAPKGMK